MRLAQSREIAYDTYVAVMEQNQRPMDVLEQKYAKQKKSLSRLDRNFVHEIVYGSLRWHSKMYWILQNTAKRDLDTTTPQIRAALVCGTYQIFYMEKVPDRAAVNESVEYIRAKGQANACSFVNGILRQIARRAAYFPKPDKEKAPVDYLSLQFSHPKWMVARWFDHFNFERMERMLASNDQPPPYSVRINTMKTPTEKINELQDSLLREEHTHSERRNLRTALHFKESPDFSSGSLFSRGYYTIQDESSQLVGFLVEPQAGELIVDACAGPGGKLSHLYELSGGKAKFVAIDRSKIQFNRAQQTMERMGFAEDIQWLKEDYLKFSPEKKVDKVLLDAPCTGLGVVRRHPEGKWQKDEASVATLAAKQRELILHALGMLKAGGELIYSVCSFEPEETLQQLQWLSEEFGDKIEIITPVSRLPDYFKRYVTRDNVLLIYPGNQDSMDGFGAFIIKLNKEL